MSKIHEDILDVMRLIAVDISELLQATIEGDAGWNNKTNTNTLKDSNLVKTINHKIGTIDNPVVEIYVNDYIEYVERGRHIHHTPRVPIDALADWVSRKLHKQPTNKLLYAIQQSIYQKGIRPRPIIYYWMQQIDKEWDRTYADLIFDTLTKDLDKILK